MTTFFIIATLFEMLCLVALLVWVHRAKARALSDEQILRYARIGVALAISAGVFSLITLAIRIFEIVR